MGNIKDKSQKILESIFVEYKNKGLFSIYLWGSAITPDYHPAISDIDTVCITSDGFHHEKEIIEKVKNADPDIKNLHSRVLFKSELEEGIPKGNLLTHVIHPRFLLWDFQTWEHVAGEQYAVSDFSQNIPTHQEVLSRLLQRIQRDSWENVDNVDLSQRKYYLKGVMRIVHILQGMRGVYESFSYSSIYRNANPQEKELIDCFKSIRESHWDNEVFEKHKNIFQIFVESLL